jgi:hypothetical protein
VYTSPVFHKIYPYGNVRWNQSSGGLVLLRPNTPLTRRLLVYFHSGAYTLQRRLASSPEAIFQSLRRRKERLERRIREERLGIRGQQTLADSLAEVPEDEDDLNAEEQENLEETLVDQATAALSISELEQEVAILQTLEHQAKAVVVSGQDRKWDELSRILQNDSSMRDAGGRQRKLIIFSEHRDTLNYLNQKIAGVLGNNERSSPSTVAPTVMNDGALRRSFVPTPRLGYSLPPTRRVKESIYRTRT